MIPAPSLGLGSYDTPSVDKTLKHDGFPLLATHLLIHPVITTSLSLLFYHVSPSTPSSPIPSCIFSPTPCSLFPRTHLLPFTPLSSLHSFYLSPPTPLSPHISLAHFFSFNPYSGLCFLLLYHIHPLLLSSSLSLLFFLITATTNYD